LSQRLTEAVGEPGLDFVQRDARHGGGVGGEAVPALRIDPEVDLAAGG
jgi:hypothetical protein